MIICNKKKLVLFLIISMVTFSFSACAGESSESLDTTSNKSSNVSEVSPKNDDMEETYADNENINQFLIDYQKVSGIKITDISKGSNFYEYYAYFEECYVELNDYNDEFSITYDFKDVPEDKLFEVLNNSLKIFNSTDEEIAKVIAAFSTENEGNHKVDDYIVNKNITCSYYPTIDGSYGIDPGYIKISCTSYNK